MLQLSQMTSGADQLNQTLRSPGIVPIEGLNILAKFNPVSSTVKRSVDQIEYLIEQGICRPENVQLTSLDMTASGEATATAIRDPKRGINAVVLFGGDGTKNRELSALEQVDPECFDIMPFVFADGGLENDGHHMTQRPRRGRNYLDELAGQPALPLRPIVTEVRDEDDSLLQQFNSYFYTGLGASSKGINKVNSRPFRTSSWLPTAIKKAHAFAVGAGPILAEPPMLAQFDEQGDFEIIRDWYAVKGSRMAGLDMFPGELTADTFDCYTLHTRTEMAIKTGKLLVGAAVSAERTSAIRMRLATLRAGHALLAFSDGEVHPVLDTSEDPDSQVIVNMFTSPTAVHVAHNISRHK